jgi:hypothetical protein
LSKFERLNLETIEMLLENKQLRIWIGKIGIVDEYQKIQDKARSQKGIKMPKEDTQNKTE